VQVAPDGGIYIAGEFESVIDFGAGPLDNVSGDDVFLAKLAP
jgi:hypothetical protein